MIGWNENPIIISLKRSYEHSENGFKHDLKCREVFILIFLENLNIPKYSLMFSLETNVIRNRKS